MLVGLSKHLLIKIRNIEENILSFRIEKRNSRRERNVRFYNVFFSSGLRKPDLFR